MRNGEKRNEGESYEEGEVDEDSEKGNKEGGAKAKTVGPRRTSRGSKIMMMERIEEEGS